MRREKISSENIPGNRIKTLVNLKWLSVITIVIALVVILLCNITPSTTLMAVLFIVISAEYFIPEYLLSKHFKNYSLKNNMEESA